MRIGVVGDTHDRMTHVDQIVELFERARVERVVHYGMDLADPPRSVEWAGFLSGRNAVGVVDLASLEPSLLRF